ncbi:hypothetical protein [Blattabacterium punctulatus]|uniref:Uncharacterized protein n=1 Tax=Blattabacterium punctulatus TaxID=164514 RepID=A0ABN5M3S4_9FLAO|nr:hypothetical protein DM808_02440 [Blattabacterium punctulatus]AWU40682.1 hypothetical protein DM805_02445 [Blattabacterium punctulatus]AWU45134.1 hypothetical protein DM803_02455 [Blattabacterium punctulatus]
MKRLLRSSFLWNKSILEKKKDKYKSYHIVFFYKGVLLPNFEEINQSVKKIFYEVIKWE